MNDAFWAGGVKVTAYILACVLAHWPGNWVIRKIIRRWKPAQDEVEDNLGAFIGTLERILTIILVGLNSFSAVGFVVAMKSIARYERVQKEKAFAEYFLAGTMLSMLLAIVLGLIVQRTVGKL
ncbi:MAG: hypothetical protein D6743_13665 [Calditrichaeota bacterium]|nr:MAG: hypothetical protein D6743_13665 [Calditrichota bacterium]